MGEGEKLHAARRRRFWTLVGALALLGMATGFVFGMASDRYEAGTPELHLLGAASIVVVAALVAYGSWRFFATVDELELADNLWGSLIGFYAYGILFPAWWAMWKIESAPEPDGWAIYLASMAVAALAYAWRKWRNN